MDCHPSGGVGSGPSTARPAPHAHHTILPGTLRRVVDGVLI